MAYIEVHTQADLDRAVARATDADTILIKSDATFNLRGSSSPTIETLDSSSPTIETLDSSSPTIETLGSSSPTIETLGSSSPTIRTWGSSSPTIETLDSSSPTIAIGRWATVAILQRGTWKEQVAGAVMLELPRLDTAELWCEYHGVEIVDGIATLFKAVDADWRGPHGGPVTYEPGSIPEAPDWDGGEAECGGGLHFSPSIGHALGFMRNCAHVVACPVALDQIVTHPDGAYPNKVKAPRCAGPVFEVDRHGRPLAVAQVSA